MTQTSSPAGIFRLNRNDLPALKAAATELGQAFFVVDLSRARNVPGFIKAMQRDLAFPEWFGGNLDALLDCLTDLSWHPAPGYIIVLSESDALKAMPTSLAALNEVLSCAVDAWNKRGIAFRIFYLQDAAA
ncbi:barstar family protein [Propionivibrio dicarboxylicus]|uniref:Barstar (Barnase inhibitor) n=1 Tax=Propionivibrio dicarboxylicus TaxID=83767 RepID=A0A1G8IMZ7_9RHOO|nr:barstar family protein [Propionivibrio dicarboxylicus]SDI20253.1 Barstar (barnase inhibitor) [Propionivibrio dicarboxylicus]